jgi:hypothetical protein
MPLARDLFVLTKYQERGFDLGQNPASVLLLNFLTRRGGLSLLHEHDLPHLPALQPADEAGAYDSGGGAGVAGAAGVLLPKLRIWGHA